MKEIKTIINFPIEGKNFKIILFKKEATTEGKVQYPNKQIHCIKVNFPPNKEEFIVIIIAPIHIIINIIEKTNPEFFLEVKHKIIPKSKQMIKGPHKSHCFNSLFFASDDTGKATTFNFEYILFKSLVKLVIIGSFKEL